MTVPWETPKKYSGFSANDRNTLMSNGTVTVLRIMKICNRDDSSLPEWYSGHNLMLSSAYRVIPWDIITAYVTYMLTLVSSLHVRVALDVQIMVVRVPNATSL